MSENKPNLQPVPQDPDAALARAREEAYLNLFEAIRGRRPAPKRANLKAV